jgi:two-component system response regulator AtoC
VNALHSHRILCVDDDAQMTRGLLSAIEQMGATGRAANSAQEALTVLRTEAIDLVITDQQMPGLQGLDLLRMMREEGFDVPVILLTGFGSIPGAVDALHAGAAHYLTKPVDPAVLETLMADVLEFKRMRQALSEDRRAALQNEGSHRLVGSGPAMQRLLRSVAQVASTRATVLIEGESGTGKELVARAIRDLSDRADQPFVAVNCAALPEGLIESTLFGHERGAFTGALNRAEGAFERADRGTLLLDEISEMRLDLQAKLLRVLQEQEFERVGGHQIIAVDVRVIATTNRDLESCVNAGTFRSDLYYRLNVLRLKIPALRERREDIDELARYFAAAAAADHGIRVESIDADLFAMLRSEHWPGNVRKLQHAIERAVVLSGGPRIRVEDFRHGFRSPSDRAPAAAAEATSQGESFSSPGHEVLILPGLDVSDAERQLIQKALVRTRNNRTAAAALLGMHARTLRRKLRKMGQDTPGDDASDH